MDVCGTLGTNSSYFVTKILSSFVVVVGDVVENRHFHFKCVNLMSDISIITIFIFVPVSSDIFFSPLKHRNIRSAPGSTSSDFNWMFVFMGLHPFHQSFFQKTRAKTCARTTFISQWSVNN